MSKKPPQDEDFDFDEMDFDQAPPARTTPAASQRKSKPASKVVPSLDEDDLDFEFDDEPSPRKHVDDHDIDLDEIPEPPSSMNNVRHTVHHEEDFDDLETGEHTEHHSHSVHEYSDDPEELTESHHYEDNEGEPVLEENEAPVAQEKKKSMLGNAIIGGGALVMAAVGYFLFFGHGNTVQTPQPTQTASTPSSNQANNPNNGPRLPQIAQSSTPGQTPVVNNGTATPRLPALPTANSTAQNTPVQGTSASNGSTNQVTIPPAKPSADPVLPTTMVAATTPNATVSSANTPSVAPVQPVLPSLPPALVVQAPVPQVASSDMSELIKSFRSINDQIEAVRKKNDDIASDLARLPGIENKIGQVDTKVDSMVSRTDSLEQRITALEQYKSTNVASGGINPRVAEARLPVVQHYSLLGVSRTAAMIRVPNGQMQVVNLGQHIDGVGVAQNISWDAQSRSWILITSAGIIRP